MSERMGQMTYCVPIDTMRGGAAVLRPHRGSLHGVFGDQDMAVHRKVQQDEDGEVDR